MAHDENAIPSGDNVKRLRHSHQPTSVDSSLNPTSTAPAARGRHSKSRGADRPSLRTTKGGLAAIPENKSALARKLAGHDVEDNRVLPENLPTLREGTSLSSNRHALAVPGAPTFEKTSHRRERAVTRKSVAGAAAGNTVHTRRGAPEQFDEISLKPPLRLPSQQRTYSISDHEEEDAENPVVTDDDGLVAAIPISDDDAEERKDEVFTHAYEYDPKSKPTIFQNRRFRICCAIGTVLFAVVLAVSIVYATKERNDVVILTPAPTAAPSLSPTSFREMVFRNYLAGIVNDKVFDPDTPHYTAADWIVNKDPMQLELADPNLVQRFLMALLYFQSTDNGNRQWTSCNPPSEGEDDSCDYVLSSFPRQNNSRWLSGQDECSWAGLDCYAGPNVDVIILGEQNMTGTLPTELVALPLLIISFLNNQISGTIPAEYASFPNLQVLELHGNKLTGTIPVEFFEQDGLALQSFNVGDNDLTGTLDPRIASTMPNLNGLHIFDNKFHGKFPSEIGNLTSLSFIRVHGNRFSGPIPTELGRLSRLQEFGFHNNLFTGTIPSELGLLSNLFSLIIRDNQLTGSIPEELFNLTALSSFELNDMALTGTLSTRVGQLTSLTTLNIQGNQLTGTIPTEIQNISILTYAYIQYNRFTGSVPNEICSLDFDILQADCAPVDNPVNPCLCCTACCDRDLVRCITRKE